MKHIGELLLGIMDKCEREAVAIKRLRDVRDEGQTLAAIERLVEEQQIEAAKVGAIDRCRENGLLSTPGKVSAWDLLTDEDMRAWL